MLFPADINRGLVILVKFLYLMLTQPNISIHGNETYL